METAKEVSVMAQPGTPPVIGVIGGSGIYEIDGLANTRWEGGFLALRRALGRSSVW